MEPRFLLTASGGRWANPALITYSFAPDGTSIGGITSRLNASLGTRFTTAAWQLQFQKAAAVWQAVANINLAQVSDDGSPFGIYGAQQHDPRFGDIRIGGTPGNANSLATAFLPAAFNGGTLAGDIVFNTQQAWQINSDFDIQTVAIHEFGHALGMDHSQIATADMYGYYTSIKQTLALDDIASIQSVYGARGIDLFDAVLGNNTFLTATDITPFVNSNAQAVVSSADISSSLDSDWYTVTAPANTTGSLVVTMQSSGLSSLNPKVMVYNASLQGLGIASSTTYGATVTVNITGVTAGQRFYVKCMAAAGGPAGIGAYGLQVNFGSATMGPIVSSVQPVAWQPDQGGGTLGQGGNAEGHVIVAIGSLTGWADRLKVRHGVHHSHVHPHLTHKFSHVSRHR